MSVFKSIEPNIYSLPVLERQLGIRDFFNRKFGSHNFRRIAILLASNIIRVTQPI